jgi:3-deoxy-7-phosphoheptulonate synthase
LKSKTHCPVIVDPSHAVGLRQFVPQLAYAAVAAGADGIMVEVHPHPEQSISDANQTISPEIFANMSLKLSDVAKLFGKSFGAK